MDTVQTQTLYDRMADKLGNRQSRKVDHNTYLQRRDEHTLALLYHVTDIVTYHSDGRVVVNTGGWLTSTTKLRLNNSYSGLPFRFYSERRVWYFTKPGNWTDALPFADGLTLTPDEHGALQVDMDTVGEDPKAQRKANARVKKFAWEFIAALKGGLVNPPSAGDCFFCVMRVDDPKTPEYMKPYKRGATLGEATKNHEHILSHIEESYFVPSLLVRAMETGACSQAMRWAVQGAWQSTPKGTDQAVFERISSGMPDFVWPQLAKMLAKYIMGQLGGAR